MGQELLLGRAALSVPMRQSMPHAGTIDKGRRAAREGHKGAAQAVWPVCMCVWFSGAVLRICTRVLHHCVYCFTVVRCGLLVQSASKPGGGRARGLSRLRSGSRSAIAAIRIPNFRSLAIEYRVSPLDSRLLLVTLPARAPWDDGSSWDLAACRAC